MRKGESKYIGKKFGKLLFTKSFGKDRYEVLCDCGRTKNIKLGTLFYRFYRDGTPKNTVRNRTGCQDCENMSPEKRIISDINKNYKYGARRRKISFLISEKDFIKLIQSPCFYCGDINSNEWTTERKKEGKLYSYKYNGIDRLDSSVGYEISNCVTCCKTCNIMKNKFSFEDFIQRVEKIYKNIKNPGVIQ